jgi:hypothetical protein
MPGSSLCQACHACAHGFVLSMPRKPSGSLQCRSARLANLAPAVAGPLVPTMANEQVLETKRFKHRSWRASVLADRAISDADIDRMGKWQEETPLGGARFRWKKSRIHLQDYEDNGYT